MKLEFDTQILGDVIRKVSCLSVEGKDPMAIYVEIPLPYAESIPFHDDAGLILMLHLIMRHEGTCRIHGKIHRTLLAHLEEYMRCWASWLPDRYHLPALVADEELEDCCDENGRQAVCAFSGGVDAAFCVCSHREKMWGHENYDIGLAVMIHGADIPLDDEEGFNMARKRAGNMLDAWNIPLACVKTNYRSCEHDWEHAFFSVVCACMVFFGGRYRHGIVGTDQTYAYDTLTVPWGENPITNHFLSIPSFCIHPCGSSFGRTDRCKVIKDFSFMLNNLRVCWQGEDKGGNCGKCEKCIRTRLNFMTAGVRHLPCMPCSLSPDMVKDMALWDRERCLYYRDILKVNSETGELPDGFVKAIREKLEESLDALRNGTRRKNVFTRLRHSFRKRF